jgi:hypothetical protein
MSQTRVCSTSDDWARANKTVIPVPVVVGAAIKINALHQPKCEGPRCERGLPFRPFSGEERFIASARSDFSVGALAMSTATSSFCCLATGRAHEAVERLVRGLPADLSDALGRMENRPYSYTVNPMLAMEAR